MPNPQVENGYTKIANELFGEMIKIHLSGNEWSILHCVMRKTWGWNKKEDRISLTQFEKETGLNRSTVNKNIKSLVAKQILVAVLQPSGNLYQIQKDYSKWTSCRIDTSCRFATTLVAKQQPVLVAELQHTKEKKETIQKKVLLRNTKQSFGNENINLIISDLKEKLSLPELDQSIKTNRQYAHLLLKASKSGIDGVLWLIGKAAEDDWWRNHITSTKDLYYNRVKIITRRRQNVRHISVIPIPE